MGVKGKPIISIKAKINAPVETVWKYWTTPENIVNWNYASDDWHTPKAINDLREGGNFNFRMEAKDGSLGFDFGGVYEKVIINKQIEYILGDERKVKVVFTSLNNKTEISQAFEAESVNSIELQRAGWQAILDNFKKYTEENK
jgi:uncharacterized protein YndB with AHSA1/START domain